MSPTRRVRPVDPPAPPGPVVPAPGPPPRRARRLDDDSTNRIGPWNWGYAGEGGSGGRTGLYSDADRQLTVSSSIIGEVIRSCYGSRRVTGQTALLFAPDGGNYAWFAFVFCFGMQDSIADLLVNNEPIASCAAWLTYGTHTGSLTQSIDTLLEAGVTVANGADYDWVSTWPGICYLAMRVDRRAADCPGSLTVSAVLGGRVIADFRDASTAASANPALVAYDLLTDARIGMGLAPASVDTAASWGRLADWCDEVMGDASARWSWAGVVQERDGWSVVAEILTHAFASMFLAGNLVKVWAYQPPQAITSVWTVAASSTTVTCPGGTGAALSELTIGDWVYVDLELHQVASIASDDAFGLAWVHAAGAADAFVRPITQVHITHAHWVTSPKGSDSPDVEHPDIVMLKYTMADTFKQGVWPAVAPGAGANTNRRVERTLLGFTDVSPCERWGQQEIALAAYCPFYWDGVADEVAAVVEPGDVILIDTDDGLSRQPVRVLPPVRRLTSGGYQLHMREYDPAAEDDSTATGDTPLTDGGGTWGTGPPDGPTDAWRFFGEAGDWEAASLLSDPDDLRAGTGWIFSGINAAYAGAGTFPWTDFTQWSPSGGGPYTATCEFDPGAAAKVLFSGIIFNESGLPDNWTVVYESYNGSWAPFSIGRMVAEHSFTSWWERWLYDVDIDTGATAHRIRFDCAGAYGDPPGAIRLARVHVVPWGTLAPQLGMFDRYTWTEHPSAADSVQSYQLVLYTRDGGVQRVVDEVLIGETSLERPLNLGKITAASSAGFAGVVPMMRTLGLNNVPVIFYFTAGYYIWEIEQRPWALDLDHLANVTETGLTTDDLLIRDAGGDWVRKPLSDLSLSGHTHGLMDLSSRTLDYGSYLTGKDSGATSRNLLGITSDLVKVGDKDLPLRCRGISSTAADPTTTDFTVDLFGIHKNTASGAVFLVYNDGGAVKKVELL